MKKYFTLSLFLLARLSFSQDTLERLDVLKTCALGTVQEVNALMSLEYTNAHRWWNFRDQYAMHHPDYEQWHGSLAGVIAANPATNTNVPFTNGVITNQNFIRTYALVAYLNDPTAYYVDLQRIDCLGNDTVILIATFRGFQVKRDANGCITHGVHYSSPANFQFRFVDYQSISTSPVQRKIFKMYAHLNANQSIQVKEELARIATGPANVPSNPASCHTYQQFLQEFEDQISN